MDWFEFGTLLLQAVIVFLIAIGIYSAIRATHRREALKDHEAKRKGPRGTI